MTVRLLRVPPARGKCSIPRHRWLQRALAIRTGWRRFAQRPSGLVAIVRVFLFVVFLLVIVFVVAIGRGGLVLVVRFGRIIIVVGRLGRDLEQGPQESQAARASAR